MDDTGPPAHAIMDEDVGAPTGGSSQVLLPPNESSADPLISRRNSRSASARPSETTTPQVELEAGPDAAPSPPAIVADDHQQDFTQEEVEDAAANALIPSGSAAQRRMTASKRQQDRLEAEAGSHRSSSPGAVQPDAPEPPAASGSRRSGGASGSRRLTERERQERDRERAEARSQDTRDNTPLPTSGRGQASGTYRKSHSSKDAAARRNAAAAAALAAQQDDAYTISSRRAGVSAARPSASQAALPLPEEVRMPTINLGTLPPAALHRYLLHYHLLAPQPLSNRQACQPFAQVDAPLPGLPVSPASEPSRKRKREAPLSAADDEIQDVSASTEDQELPRGTGEGFFDATMDDLDDDSIGLPQAEQLRDLSVWDGPDEAKERLARLAHSHWDRFPTVKEGETITNFMFAVRMKGKALKAVPPV
ncbi:uncharacterized protein L969DRAFT_428862 [Mixia osmundae IAM 14324]|uniref:Uncharacterized protein n=1 Tax=Mixia osmundae (strain CBS 9802 / IAM 14324 / JCM 22182 / KY 12970) TaxID=764103 RepID=G7E8B3_MIXOS|nr:uncharacterized protein L969DRAFT_428862 [Mixia osmundae IAM 14324]KEI39176.1 hypothetical protein L969DRAFT_428862 [Mixia osmundae IAM 14324]GAA99073.1 hypothetical protein E5Q_05762 [Mixia osmundae IAM 14324]